MAQKHKHSKQRCKSLVSRKIRKNIKEGKPKKQAIAIAISQARREGCKIPIINSKKIKGGELMVFKKGVKHKRRTTRRIGRPKTTKRKVGRRVGRPKRRR